MASSPDIFIKRVNVTMPAPTLVSGRPTQPWTPTVSTTNWGSLKVSTSVKGSTAWTDVTWIRGVPARVEEWASSDPLSDLTARVTFPQFTAFDQVGAGDFAAINKFRKLNISWLDAATTTETILWEGYAAAWHVKQDANGAALQVDCQGACYQLSLYRRGPQGGSHADALEDILATQFDSTVSKPALHTSALVTISTGITSRTKGAWQNDLEYVLEELGKAVTSSGTVQYTVLLDRPRTPRLQTRDTTTVGWTYTVGTPGVDVDLQQDYTDAANVIYGEAQDEAGSLVRNLVPDNVGTGGAWFQPWAFTGSVHNVVLNDSTGALSTQSGLDTTVARVERYINFGEGINRTEVKNLAAQYLARDMDPGWSGRVTVNVGPEESKHHLEMQAGQNLRLREWAGSGHTGTTFHISGVEHTRNGDKWTTVATVDTKARDLFALEDIIRRNKEGKSPARMLRPGRATMTVEDRKVPWDGKQSGYYPIARAWDGTSTVSVTANTWSVTKVLLAGGPFTIVKTDFTASTTASGFGLYVFDWNITSSDLPSNPFADGAWDTPPAGFIVGWGGFGQHAGYSPGLESNSDAITGRLLDEGPWDVPVSRGSASSAAGDSSNSATQPVFYVAVYHPTTCTIYGRFYHGG